MMGFTAKGKPSFTDHIDHDEPRGCGFTSDVQPALQLAQGDVKVSCTSVSLSFPRAEHVTRANRRHAAMRVH